MDKDKIKVEGHKGTWYVVAEVEFFYKHYYLLEHNFYGEDAPWIAIDMNGKLVMEDITEGVDEFLDRMDAELCEPTAEDVAEWQNWI